jgi:ubiquitin-conjugating enzyme E2 S
VEESTGSVCLDTLKRDWQPNLTLRDILVTISCLLINPNPDSALNADAGKLIQEDFDAFSRKARLMTSIHATVPKALTATVREAITRGEDKPKDDINIAEDESEYEDDEALASKENDPSISPSPVSPTAPVQRNSVLGKRPLADLPIPVEPLDDQLLVSASERNVIANTPNLSTDMSCLSFTNETNQASSSSSLPASTRYQLPRPTKRSHSPSSDAGSAIFTFTGMPTSNNSESTVLPSLKRRCTLEGKENQSQGIDKIRPRDISLQPLKASAVGLGVKNLAPVKKNNSSTTGSKSKARVGLRRL